VILPEGPSSAACKWFPAFLLISSFIAGGCSPPGTGSVKVQDRGKVVEQLSKGARPNQKNGKPVDDQGIKFRKKD
jgi:hypothetical protein